jgi:Putative auto-transporter adhesin, head GIN domain
MQKLFSLILFSVISLFSIAQDKIVNDPHAEIRNLSGSFHGIKISNGIELVLKQGGTEAVAVSASTVEYRNKIKTEISNGILKIYYDDKMNWGWNKERKYLKAYVSFKELDLLDASSGSQTTIDGAMNCSKLAVDISSGAGIKGKIEASEMKVDQSSGSTMKVTGKVGNLSVETSSGAGFYGYDLESDNCDADASSGGSIYISVNKELQADASSGGDIRYKGAGVITKLKTGSGGSVKKNG